MRNVLAKHGKDAFPERARALLCRKGLFARIQNIHGFFHKAARRFLCDVVTLLKGVNAPLCESLTFLGPTGNLD